MGWGELLGRALQWSPGLAQHLLQHCFPGGSAVLEDHILPSPQGAGAPLLGMLLADLAAQVCRRLEGSCWEQALRPGAGALGASQAPAELDALAAELAPDLELLQQGLLTWQSADALIIARDAQVRLVLLSLWWCCFYGRVVDIVMGDWGSSVAARAT
jgi:hypothetical protein